MNITREVTQTFKQGVRDSRAWGFGNYLFWGSVSMCETANYDKAVMMQFGSFGLCVQISVIRMQYRGG